MKNAIAIHGFKWKAVSDEMGTRNPDRKKSSVKHESLVLTDGLECAKRWRNALDPNLIRGKWTDEDVNFPQSTSFTEPWLTCNRIVYSNMLSQNTGDDENGRT